MIKKYNQHLIWPNNINKNNNYDVYSFFVIKHEKEDNRWHVEDINRAADLQF